MQKLKNLHITPKMTMVFILFATLLLLGLSVPAYLNARAALRSATISELLATALEKEAALNTWVENRTHSIEDISKQPNLQTTLQRYMNLPVGSSQAKSLYKDIVADLENWSGMGHLFITFQLIDSSNGQILVSTNPIDEGKFRESEPYFIKGLSGAGVENPTYDLTSASNVMMGFAPVHAPDGTLLAVLTGSLDLSEMYTIIQRRTGLHQTDEAFLVNKSNFYVTQPRLLENPSILLRGIHTIAVDTCLTHNSGVYEGNNYRGIPAIVVYRWIVERDMCLIVKIEQQEAYIAARALTLTFILVGGLVLLAGSLASVAIARSLARPVHELVDKTNQFGEGDLETRIQVRSTDEIGMLGQAFNLMADSMQSKDAQLREWGAELEQKVEQRTLELRESEERYRILAETSPDMIFVIDKADQVQYVNPLAARQFGKKPVEVIGRPRLELFPPVIAERQGISIQQVFQTGVPLSTESPVIFPGGQIWLDTDLVPMRDNEGSITAVMGVARDITDRKQADLIILQEKDFSDSIINSLPGIFYLFNTDGKFLRWNNNFEQISGYSADEMLERDMVDFFTGEDREHIQESIQQVFLSGQAAVEANFITKDGTGIPYHLTGIRIQLNGKPHLAGVGIDITERKLAEVKLFDAMADLARSNSELERFAYVASHDLQEPLSMVKSYLQLLEKRYNDKLDEDANEFIKFAVEGSQRMKDLISDLLAYSRVGTRGKDFEIVDCEKILENVLQNLQISLEENHAKLTHDALPMVMADDVQITSLFQNLIGNAIKFHSDAPPLIHVGVKQEAKNWVFSVRDNGIGIDQQYFERIFIIFQRLHSRQEYAGTGIGLAISKRIVERHGGHIWIESQPGQGSTFFFTLPMILR